MPARWRPANWDEKIQASTAGTGREPAVRRLVRGHRPLRPRPSSRASGASIPMPSLTGRWPARRQSRRFSRSLSAATSRKQGSGLGISSTTPSAPMRGRLPCSKGIGLVPSLLSVPHSDPFVNATPALLGRAGRSGPISWRRSPRSCRAAAPPSRAMPIAIFKATQIEVLRRRLSRCKGGSRAMPPAQIASATGLPVAQ